MFTEKEKLKLLAQNIARHRKAKHLSQNELAEMADTSREHLAKIETSKKGISLSLLFRICNSLNISEQELFDFSKK